MMVSFVIPSFNQGRFIGECLDSISSQGLANDQVETIVVDGGSSDDSVAIISDHPCVSQWVSEPDKGHADALNKGIALASGAFIAWINSDDYYLDGAWSRLLPTLEKHPEIDVFYGDAKEVDQFGEWIADYPTIEWEYDRLIDRCFISQPACLIRRTVFARFGALSTECRVGIDLEYWLRIGRQCRFLHVPVQMAASRLWCDTKSSLRQQDMQLDALYYGRLHGGRWSSRRLWSYADACARDSIRGRGYRGELLVWTLKTLNFLRIRNRCRRFDAKIDNGPKIDCLQIHGSPSVSASG